MNFFIPVLYICLGGHCEFLQQLAVYPSEQFCKQSVLEKVNEYKKQAPTSTIEATCVVVPDQVVEEPKSKSRIDS